MKSTWSGQRGRDIDLNENSRYLGGVVSFGSSGKLELSKLNIPVLNQKMLKYITMVYEGENYHEEFGWEFGKVILFESAAHDSPSDAMEEFNKFQLPENKAWFAYMRVTTNGEITDEQMFDTSTARVD